MSSIHYQKDTDDIVTLTIDMPGQSANTMNGAFRADYAAMAARLEAERESIAGVILTSAKKTFFAGGDLNSLLAASADQKAELFARAESMKASMRRIERLGKPVVATINGAALGGGFELCLACHARFALDHPSVTLGLPEAGLGLLPGGGGVVRLVRMLGLEAAVPLLTDGSTFAPARALELKLLDGLAPDQAELMRLARQWILDHPEPAQPWDQKGWRLPGSTAQAPAALAFLRTAPVLLVKKTRGCYPAPLAILSAAVEGAVVDFDTASRIESRHFVGLATGPVAKNLITTFFFQMNEIKAGKGRPEGVPPATFQRVGVLGAGMMGAGIAFANATHGIATVLKDVSAEQASKGKAHSEKLLAKRIAKGAMTEARRDQILQTITPTADAADLAGCELIIEAVFEKRELKAQVTAEAEPRLGEGGIFASNTSTLPISGLAQASAHPERFIGLHFFSPVDRMPLVEVIKGQKTSPETLARALDYVKQIGKTPIVVNDSRGFFTSRVFGTFTKEGAAMLGEGVPAAQVENAALGVGMPVGPLSVMDETSMALSLSVKRQAEADLAAEGKSFPSHPGWAVIERMAEGLGRPGRASGGGFYDYPEGEPKRLWPGLDAEFGRTGVAIPMQDLRDRILYVQAIEAIRIMQEGVIDSARDANIGSVLGIGFPRWTGGVLQFVNMVGLRDFAMRASELARRYGERFEPPALLLDMAERNQRFT
ncbi:3-hydroxyacyl-CoA dehydrogenase NAD-binding domain-containing protein [Variovorax sp. J31P207]|uniref:3-hydroxyacyl-CoA dehydrogenase NAD-binding domain-containing protein n=1 Tax=Variovorax sp. J31P207 TaxID=3053510 RepID=UPI002577FD83|nr:3-hydroxyacyl-CoA dehydrogenase NAD-binding domain-containing protein [Variovorax sp. J31P207]MDM0066826.1 3-hydroxyacyl-CoA dehydrogenase NAD-binding domain-containing protein [Variovorax sp. J31P207]